MAKKNTVVTKKVLGSVQRFFVPTNLSVNLIGVGKGHRCYVWEIMEDEARPVGFIKYFEVTDKFHIDSDVIAFSGAEMKKLRQMCESDMAESILLDSKDE